MNRTSPSRLARSSPYKLAAIAFVSGLAGTLLALWLWQAFTEHRANVKASEAKALAEAKRGSPEGRQQEAVKRYLNDADSALFRSEHESKVSREFWCGEINAKNKMGGMVGFQRYVVELQRDPKLADLDAAQIDQSGREPKTDEDVRFLAYWNGYCQ